MQDWKAKEMARAAAAKAVQAANPHLVPVSDKVNSLVAAAKNARIELARAFPGVKFSVKTSRFSGGDSMDVRWVDGPNTSQVDAIVDKYAAGVFNGSDDSYSYTADAWNQAFGDAKYVHTTRDLSDKAIASAIRTFKAEYAADLGDKANDVTVEAFRAGKLWAVHMPNGVCNSDIQAMVSQIAYSRTWAIDKTPKAVPMVEAKGEPA
jgi:hypothetical protein